MLSPSAVANIPCPDYRLVFEAVPDLYLVLAPDAPVFTILGGSDAYLRATMTRRDGPSGIIGLPMFTAFPDPPDAERATGTRNLRASLERALATGRMNVMDVQHYDIRRPDGSWEERHWAPRNVPVLGSDRRVCYLIHQVEDVTKLVRAQAAERAARAAVEAAQAALEEAQGELRRERALLRDAHSQSAALRKESDSLRAKIRELMATAGRYWMRAGSCGSGRARGARAGTSCVVLTTSNPSPPITAASSDVWPAVG